MEFFDRPGRRENKAKFIYYQRGRRKAGGRMSMDDREDG
jgi:hypothetical protein